MVRFQASAKTNRVRDSVGSGPTPAVPHAPEQRLLPGHLSIHLEPALRAYGERFNR